MFSQTVPGFSCRLNAWATAATCQWLMGPCEVNSCDTDSQEQAPGHGVLIERYQTLSLMRACLLSRSWLQVSERQTSTMLTCFSSRGGIHHMQASG